MTRDQVRRVDQLAVEDLKIPGIVLMENAGRNLTDEVEDILAELGAGSAASVLIVCGKGNNGGDGFVLARHLHNRGHRPRCLLLGELTSAPDEGDAAINRRIVEAMGLPLSACPDPDSLAAALEQARDAGAALLVDAYLGTGLADALHDKAVARVEAMNSSRLPICAVDAPSGLDCDRGVPLGAAVKARWTVTMAAPKVGFAVEGAEAWTGDVRLVDIGAPPELLARARDA